MAVDGVERTALAPPVTDPDEHYLAQEALLTEAAWFVQVDCSATLELLGFPPQPHQVVDVQYAGDRLSGPYQVMKATHIVNAADTYVDFKIRANGRAHVESGWPAGRSAVSEDVDRVVQALSQRFFGKYRGEVTDTADSTNRARLKVKCPAVLGEQEVWAMPCVPYAGDSVGFFALPPVGHVGLGRVRGRRDQPADLGRLLLEGRRDRLRATPRRASCSSRPPG